MNIEVLRYWGKVACIIAGVYVASGIVCEAFVEYAEERFKKRGLSKDKWDFNVKQMKKSATIPIVNTIYVISFILGYTAGIFRKRK